MNENPYQAPLAKPAEHRPDDIPGQIRYREFRGGAFSVVLNARKHMEKLRREAEAFINSGVGVENVVSIAEHTGLEYSITVWYRTHVPSGRATL